MRAIGTSTTYNGYWSQSSFTSQNTTKPNLTPSNVAVGGSSAQAGGTLAVNWRMSNTGTAAAATSTGIRIGTSNTTHPASSGIPTVTTGPIPAGSYLDQAATVTVPAGTAPGTYYVWVIADNSSPVTLDQTTQADDWAVSGSFTVSPQSRPHVAVVVSGSPLANGQSAPVSFGTVQQGSAGPSLTFSVQNTGHPSLAPLAFEQIMTAQIAAFVSDQVAGRGLAPKNANRYREILSRLFS